MFQEIDAKIPDLREAFFAQFGGESHIIFLYEIGPMHFF